MYGADCDESTTHNALTPGNMLITMFNTMMAQFRVELRQAHDQPYSYCVRPRPDGENRRRNKKRKEEPVNTEFNDMFK